AYTLSLHDALPISANEDIGFWEARGAQTSCSSLGNGSSSARGEARLDFDKFLVNVVGELSLRIGARRLCANATEIEKHDESQIKQMRLFHCRHARILPRAGLFKQLSQRYNATVNDHC